MAGDDWKVLHDAVKRNDMAAVRSFIEDGQVSISSKIDRVGRDTAAHLAARTGNVEMIKYFASKEPSVLSIPNVSNQTVFHLAVTKGSLPIVKYLVDEMNFDIFHADNLRQGNNAVHLAAREGHTDIVKYFIDEKHVDVNIRNESGEPPIFLAALKKQLHVIKFLLEQRNANATMIDFNDQNILFPATLSGDVAIPTYFLDEKKIELEIGWRDKLGRNVLHWSSFTNKLEITQYFVEQKGADVNALDLKNQTALHLAAQGGNKKLVEFLLEAGAEPTLEDAEGKTPAQVTRKKELAKILNDFSEKRERERRSAPELTVSRDRFTVQQPSVSHEWPMLSLQGYLSNSRMSQQQVASIGPEGILALANIYFGYDKRSKNHISPSPIESIRNRIDPVATDVIGSLS